MNKRKRQQQDPGILSCSKAAVFLIILNTGIFIFSHFTDPGRNFFQNMILHAGNLMNGNYLSLLASGFLHSDWIHLVLNMLAVFIFGSIVEGRMGFKTTLFIYFGSLIISMVSALIIYLAVLHRNVAIIGASGAVMGLMATAMLMSPFSITWEMLLPIPTMVKGWMFFYADFKGFLGGETDGISHLAHLCGFLSVMVLVYFLSREDRKKMTAGLVINLASLVAAAWIRNKFLI
ncbi:MAG: rhomboid family intramembrane serine protease [Candidatus Omnitrophota bacterium]